MSSLKDFLFECRQSVDEALEQLLPDAAVEPKRLHEAIRWSIFAGGKRFRPALVLAVGESFGVPKEKLLKTAAAAEMIHTYSLIHDDLPAMDDDDLRRGRETCHKKFDEATAILAGDCLQNLAFQTIAEDGGLSDRIKIRLISELANAAGTPLGMVAGQQLDLEAEGRSVSLADLENIHRRKTGAMICFSARAGAIIAEIDERKLKIISDYAEKLGLLFQVTDDLLDVTQTTAVLGKTAGKDAAAEKATYPALYGVEETRRLTETFHAEAVRDLDSLGGNTGILRELVDFILCRTA